MLHYLFQRLYNTSFWSNFIPSIDIFHPSGGYDMYHYVLHWKLYNYTNIVSSRFAFDSALILVLHIDVSGGSIIASAL